MFWVFMLVMCLLTPFTMIFFGHRYHKNPPREINNVSGYRTEMSMKNRETWEFAHAYIGKLWKICGWTSLPISVAVMLLVFGKEIVVTGITGGIICAVQIVIMICTIIPTEIALKRNFGKDGNPH